MTAASALDPEIAEFAADQDRTFAADFHAQPIAERRARYDAFWRRFNAPPPNHVTIENMSLALPGRSLALRNYRPVEVRRPLPVIVYCHGGFWMFGGLDSHDLPAARLASIAEAAVVAVDYRLAPEHKFPAALIDVWEALNWVVVPLGRIGLDPQRVAVAGDSAGGALAAGIAQLARDRGSPALRAQGLVYPALRPSRAAGAVESPGRDETAIADALSSYFARPQDARDPYAMPLLATNFAGLPPAVICAAELDVLMADARSFDVALKRAGVRSRLIVGHGLPHRFLRALHLCDAAARAFEAFGQEMGRLLHA
ncbi:MAG: alpha/beta hydrolase [Rhodospirillaceae bacterium]|nr:alpha/beta hydrolase [Rhodospirillaceae bacterium]